MNPNRPTVRRQPLRHLNRHLMINTQSTTSRRIQVRTKHQSRNRRLTVTQVSHSNHTQLPNRNNNNHHLRTYVRHRMRIFTLHQHLPQRRTRHTPLHINLSPLMTKRTSRPHLMMPLSTNLTSINQSHMTTQVRTLTILTISTTSMTSSIHRRLTLQMMTHRMERRLSTKRLITVSNRTNSLLLTRRRLRQSILRTSPHTPFLIRTTSLILTRIRRIHRPHRNHVSVTSLLKRRLRPMLKRILHRRRTITIMSRTTHQHRQPRPSTVLLQTRFRLNITIRLRPHRAPARRRRHNRRRHRNRPNTTPRRHTFRNQILSHTQLRSSQRQTHTHTASADEGDRNRDDVPVAKPVRGDRSNEPSPIGTHDVDVAVQSLADDTDATDSYYDVKGGHVHNQVHDAVGTDAAEHDTYSPDELPIEGSPTEPVTGTEPEPVHTNTSDTR